MNINKLTKGSVLFNPKTTMYIHIKEITRDTEKHSAQYFVCSKECKYFSDSQTTISRMVLNRSEMGDYFYLAPIGYGVEE